MIKDLEPLLEKFCQQGNYEVEAAIMQFGHGECHDLTLALHEKYNAKIIAIVGQSSGLPIHSCVLINENITLDAYGINSLQDTLKRYNKLSIINLEEPAIIKFVEPDLIYSFGGLAFSDIEDVLNDFQPIIDILEIDLNIIFNS